MTKGNKEKSISKEISVGKDHWTIIDVRLFFNTRQWDTLGLQLFLLPSSWAFSTVFQPQTLLIFDESLECVLSDQSIPTRCFTAKETFLFKDRTSYIYKRRPGKPDLLVVCRTKMQRTKLGTLTYVSWIADRFGDGGLASRFLRKAGAFVHCEKTSSYPLFTCPFLHRDLNSS